MAVKLRLPAQEIAAPFAEMRFAMQQKISKTARATARPLLFAATANANRENQQAVRLIAEASLLQAQDIAETEHASHQRLRQAAPMIVGAFLRWQAQDTAEMERASRQQKTQQIALLIVEALLHQPHPPPEDATSTAFARLEKQPIPAWLTAGSLRLQTPAMQIIYVNLANPQ